MAFEYKYVKQALREFVATALSIPEARIFKSPPKPTDITVYPAVIIRSATAVQSPLGGDGPTTITYTLLLGIMTRNQTSQGASDELDDLLKLLDTAIAASGVEGLPTTSLTNSRWLNMTRLEKQTQFDNVIQDDVGMVVYGVTAPVDIEEMTPYTQG